VSANPCQREIFVEIPADVVAQKRQVVTANYLKHARIPGFRRGKTPTSLVASRFAAEIKKDVLEALAGSFFQQEADKQQLSPVAQPSIDELKFDDEGPITFKAIFEVLPEFSVEGYKDIKVEHEKVEVAESEVEDTIAGLREQKAVYEAVEETRAIVDGDFAEISFEAVESGVEGAEPVKQDEALVGVGDKNTVAEFSENLRGKKPGDIVEFPVQYAEDFPGKQLAGKKYDYKVVVKGIKSKKAPELNDEFAKELGEEFNTLDELKAKIRENLEHQKSHEVEHKGKDAIVAQLLEKFTFAVPNAMVEHQTDIRLERGLRALMGQGLRPEQIKGMDLSGLRTAQRAEAEKEVRQNLILGKIAAAEKIVITDEEFEQQVASVAAQSRMSVEEAKQRLAENGGEQSLRGRMLEEKALENLYHQN